MINIWFDDSTKKIILGSDDPSVRYFLEIKKETAEYIPWQKSWGKVRRLYKVYDKKKTVDGITYYQIGMGWTGLVANIFSPYIDKQMHDSLIQSVMSPTYRTQPFPELRDYQNQDVLHILKFKVGLFSCYTSYGRNLPSYVEIYNSNRAKTVKAEMPIPC